MSRSPSPRSRPPRRWVLAALAVMAVALVLRVLFIRAGLPGLGMLSPDEGTVVPKSVDLVSRGTWNPEWFLYPSGFFVTLATLVRVIGPVMTPSPGLTWGTELDLQLDPTPYMLAGRSISIVAGLVVVAATYLVARRLCGGRWALLAAGLIAISPLAVTYSHYAVTDMAMTAVLTLCIWRLLVAVSTDRLRDIVIAAGLAGLAVSYKYNAGLILVPMFVWLAVRRGPTLARRIRDVALAGTTALAGFLALTPYALLDWDTFREDLELQNDIQRNGWLGFESTGSGFVLNITPNLTTAVGVVGLLLAVVGMGVGLRRGTAADWILWPYVIGSYLYISRWNSNFDRYVLPFLAIVAVAAAVGARWAWERLPARYRTPALAVVAGVAIAVQPAVGTVRDLNRLTLPEHRLAALPTIERMIPDRSVVAAEPLTPPIPLAEFMTPVEAIDGIHRTAYTSIRLYPPQPGRPFHRLRDVCRILRRDIRWVMTSDDIERRVRAAGTRYPQDLAFYDSLPDRADLRLAIPAGLGPGAKVWELRPDPACTPAATRAG